MGEGHSKEGSIGEGPARKDTSQQSKETLQKQEAAKEKSNKLTIVDSRVEDGAITIQYEGPLTVQKLIQAASSDHQIFFVRFPNENNQEAFLNTATKTLSFQPEPTHPDLSVLMILKPSPTLTNNYTWSNVIIPETYLRVTDAYQYGGRLLTFEPALENVPVWSAEASPQDEKLLSFLTTETDGTQWYQQPVTSEAETQINNIVLGMEDQIFAAHVFHVTNKTAEDIHFNIHIIPPSVSN